MLERTAATLESCTSLHALPSATRQLRSQRRLHTGFWQHGAAAIDISSSVLAMRFNGTEYPAPSDPPSAPLETLAASTFLLDFLYPSGTATFLRRTSPGLPHDHLTPLQRLPRRSRPFTSSTVATSTKDSDSPETFSSGVQSMPQDRDAGASAVGSRRYADQEGVDPAEEDDFEEEEDEEEVDDALDVTDSRDTHSGPSYAGAGSRPELMRELMADRDTEYFGSIWQLYTQLEPSLQPEFRPEVIAYLYRSANIIDARRVVLLFPQVDDSQWSAMVLTSVVTAYLRLGREAEALRLYHTGLDEKALVCGLDELLGHFFEKADWTTVIRVWASYHTVYLSHGTKAGNLNQLAATANLGALTIRFAREIKAQEPEVAQKLTILLNKAARRALMQPCEPEEALPLLKIIDQSKWYNIYLSEALARGQQKCLPEIYRVYRSFPGVIAYWKILHGMFDIFYPEDVAGLEQIYEDYHTSYGQLDQWGFRKFLKYYASRGDIKSLERLWDNYVHAYHHRNVLREPDTFNHIVNAYASLGDYKGARRFFDELRDKHGVTPSIQSWNQLLKSCLECNDYDLALSVFEELCESTQPDGHSFATIMSMTSRNGDLSKTNKFLERAKSLGIEPDVPILEAVIRAYSWHYRTNVMLSICIEAQANNVAGDHARLWNTVVRFHSLRRNLAGLSHVLETMANHGVKWTSETHRLVFSALISCGQTQAAYKMLRSAIASKSFEVTREHFMTVIKGALDSRQLLLASKLTKHLQRYRLMTVKARTIKARGTIKERLFAYHYDPKNGDGVEELMKYIRDLANTVNKAPSRDGSQNDKELLRRADSLHRLRQALDQAIKLFDQYRDFASVKELEQLRRSIGVADGNTTNATGENISVHWLHFLMKDDLANKKYDEALAKWEQILQKFSVIARPASFKDVHTTVIPRYRLGLSKPFETLLKLFVGLHAPAQLKKAFDEVLNLGFSFDRRAFNHTVQVLARLGSWMDACTICETWLMPSWTGWQQNRMRALVKTNLPLAERRMASVPSVLRPTSYTIIVLVKDYNNLQRMAPWSSAAAAQLSDFKAQCPSLAEAFRTLPYTGVGIEREVFGSQKKDAANTEKTSESAQRSWPFSQTNDGNLAHLEEDAAGSQTESSALSAQQPGPSSSTTTGGAAVDGEGEKIGPRTRDSSSSVEGASE
ncbi:pentatricopeptide repeat domain-containing protein [Colletotrichum orchidophilum]|uniref:Pentatricopeptide repeat domain-containing protein n=1 Tax=Colletotrichum orchidophilum TaxID=1209926 RepID=A0A1G4BJK3_9PEZI|nr:pentatricopeptide repeat domain-containing protein [Colletotrichum orchidophilum]OHF01478.1 pentatricopeptide repeat domain-containing protein [Colletotrichum orchidophilum]